LAVGAYLPGAPAPTRHRTDDRKAPTEGAGAIVGAVAFNLSKVIHAPIEDVFRFFDDPEMTLEFNTHAVSLKVVDVQPDGRQTFDVVMRSDASEWMQTVEQVVREQPTRLTTLGGSWTTDRRHRGLTIITDRRFTTEGGGTRLDITIEGGLDHPFRRPLQAITNWLLQGVARRRWEHQLDLIASRIEDPGGTTARAKRS
jgi:uncharacterized protein YndB with AHSA1/START domain